MDKTNYNLAQLWPDFQRVWIGDLTSAEGLSAAIVLVLICATALFAVLSFKNFVQANMHLRFYRKLLTGLEAGQLLEKRRDIFNVALKNKRYGQLWKEFDESLVHLAHKERLCNTFDAEHFFNTHTIARGLTENRLLAAVPGFLTAIGVIGTFAGLQMGLSSLSANMGETPKIDELTVGIFGMIGGASIAFMTSVWGVFTSVLFNFYEKLLERNIRGAIASFQNRVDYLYPRITAEQSLANIDDSSRVSSEKLAELDEKIGHRLQEAMQQASTSIREGMEHSLNTILGPAIEKLVNNAHSGSEKALESLLERFMESVGGAGNAQKDMMQNASHEMKVATESMAVGLNNFVGNLESQFDRMVNQNESTLTNVQSALSQQIEDQQGREVARQRLLNDQMKSVQTTQQTLTEGIESVVEHQKIQQQELVSELSQLLEKFGLLSESHVAATDNMRQVSGDMKASSNQLGLLSANIKESVDFLGQDLEKSIAQVQLLGEQNAALVSKFDGMTNQLGSAGQQVELAARQLDSAAGKAESGLSSVDRHFEQLGRSLTTHVQQLERQVAALLTEYSNLVHTQTTNRMNVWNEQTGSYISSMTDAIQALSGVVDEIDGKIRA